MVVEPQIRTWLGEETTTCGYDPSSLVIDEVARGEQHAHLGSDEEVGLVRHPEFNNCSILFMAS
jgi:hypothetical protein